MNYICIRKCFFSGRLWQPGDTANFGPQDAGSPSVVAHFAVCGGMASVPVATEQPVVEGEEVVTPAAESADNSSAKENLKALCLRNGIKVVARTTMAQMREALAEKGVVVN
jgi:hypothetical protein